MYDQLQYFVIYIVDIKKRKVSIRNFNSNIFSGKECQWIKTFEADCAQGQLKIVSQEKPLHLKQIYSCHISKNLKFLDNQLIIQPARQKTINSSSIFLPKKMRSYEKKKICFSLIFTLTMRKRRGHSIDHKNVHSARKIPNAAAENKAKTIVFTTMLVNYSYKKRRK